MDTFIERFKRFAESQGWNRDERAVPLSPLLTGKGLQVFTSMPSDEALQYDVLKKALLKRYEMTEEGFRNKFRHTKPEQGETAHQFVASLQRYFNRWVDMSGCVKEYKELANLLIREQFVNTCSAEMALFLRERVPKNIGELVKLAELYLEAHGIRIQAKPNRRKLTKMKADAMYVISKYTWLRTVNKPKTSSSGSPHRKQQVQLR